ncbi:MAG: acyl-CoA dehydrogenase family protein [Deltaproteobacteria bacterium]|nr:acyl-CoA dehydrogenase family protein [Deltaproteobacteria bacterium]
MIPQVVGLPPGLEHTLAGPEDRALAEVALRARCFARGVLAPAALGIDRRVGDDPTYFPWEIVRAGAREGWLGAAAPRAWGGGGLGIAAVSVVMEEMSAADSGAALIFGAHGLGMLPLMLSMDIGLAARVIGEHTRAERRGEPKLCAFAITEPGGGSDVEEAEGLARFDAGITRATHVRDGYVLRGRKLFISNGNVAEHVVVFAALDARAPASSWTAFVVRRGTPGLGSPRVESKMGQRACPAAELVLEDVVVPRGMRVGAEGSGWELSRRTLAVSRGPVGAIAVGIGRGAFEVALEHVRATGRAEAWVHDALARMIVQLRTARAAYLEAARHCDALLPAPAAREAVALLGRAPRSIVPPAGWLERRTDTASARSGWAHQAVLGATAKIAGSDAAMAVTTVALDLVPPGAGAARARVEKAFRDAKLTQIYEGTNQINLRAIAAESWARHPW